MRKYRDEVSGALHAAARDLYETGMLDKETMRGFDARHLVVEEIAPAKIKAIREANNLSQPVFASYMNMTKSTIEKWETGAKKPTGAALRLLQIVEKHGIGLISASL